MQIVGGVLAILSGVILVLFFAKLDEVFQIQKKYCIFIKYKVLNVVSNTKCFPRAAVFKMYVSDGCPFRQQNQNQTFFSLVILLPGCPSSTIRTAYIGHFEYVCVSASKNFDVRPPFLIHDLGGCVKNEPGIWTFAKWCNIWTFEHKYQVIAWKYKLLFDNEISRGTLTAMAGLIVLAIMVRIASIFSSLALSSTQLSSRLIYDLTIKLIRCLQRNILVFIENWIFFLMTPV